MGFYIRKSVSFGPVRINISKSGIGTSVGVKGARISTGPRGTYLHLGRYGVYYRERLDGANKAPVESETGTATHWEQRPGQPDSADLVDFSPSAIANEINRRSKTPAAWGWSVLATAVAAGCFLFIAALILASSSEAQIASGEGAGRTVPFVLLSLGIAVGGGLIAHRMYVKDTLRRTTPIFFELTEAETQSFSRTNDAARHLSTAHRVWYVGSTTPTPDWKRNAGCHNLVSRRPICLGPFDPPFVATNLSIQCMDVGLTKLFFFPRELFIFRQGTYSTVPYEAVEAAWSNITFVEEEAVPRDAVVTGRQWRYVRKDGGPDLRFSNNVQIPVVTYGEVALRIGQNVLTLMVSSTQAAQDFCRCINVREGRKPKLERDRPPQGTEDTWKEGEREREQERKHQQEHERTRGQDRLREQEPRTHESEVQRCAAILGVRPTVNSEDLTHAYRRRAHECHPDKVAGLSEDFRKLAEQKMKELNYAYGFLKDEILARPPIDQHPPSLEPKFVRCSCQHCGGNIEFDANELGDRTSVSVPCPHCGIQTEVSKPIGKAQADGSSRPSYAAFFRACQSGDMGSFRNLLALVDVNQRASPGVTALHVAASLGHVEVVRVLLDNGAEADPKLGLLRCSYGGELAGATPLILAVVNQAPNVAQLLLDRGADSTATTDKGYSAQGIVQLLHRLGQTRIQLRVV